MDYLSAIREVVQNLPKWISSVGEDTWQKVAVAAASILGSIAAGAALKRLATPPAPSFQQGDKIRWKKLNPGSYPEGVITRIDEQTKKISAMFGGPRGTLCGEIRPKDLELIK
jgi:hypothetical protein